MIFIGSGIADAAGEVMKAAGASVPAGGSLTGALGGSPFAVGQFVTIISWNSGPAGATMSSPASGFTAHYNSNNGTRAANLWSIASLASATQTITFSATRTRTRTLGWTNVQTGIVAFDVTYGTTPLTPGVLDVTGKPRAKIYSIIGGTTASITFTAPGDLSDDGGLNGANGWRRAELTTAVGAVSSYQVGQWTSTDNTQQLVCITIAVE